MTTSPLKNITFFRNKGSDKAEYADNQTIKHILKEHRKVLSLAGGIIIVICFIISVVQYRLWISPNLHLPEVAPETSEAEQSHGTNEAEQSQTASNANRYSGSISLNIYENESFDTIMSKLTPYLISPKKFAKAAKRTKYTNHIRSGHYVFKEGMSNREMLQMLRRGLQTPVRICFSIVRTPEQLAGILSRQLMLDSATIITAFRDNSRLEALGLNQQTLPALFIPDTYEVWWNSPAEKLMKRFEQVYNQYWTAERKALVKANGLTPIEAATLASIVQDESNRKDEWPVIAGLYLNRLRKGMPLQACPTIKFVMNDFAMRRVLKEYTEVESPYNTYIHQGLPPGPIGIATKQVLEAVVHAEPNNFLYMCAKDDFSGSHYFSTNLTQHNIYALRYHAALTKKRIW